MNRLSDSKREIERNGKNAHANLHGLSMAHGIFAGLFIFAYIPPKQQTAVYDIIKNLRDDGVLI